MARVSCVLLSLLFMTVSRVVSQVIPTFREYSAQAGLDNPGGPYGIAFVDVDGDGLEDIWVPNTGVADRLYINLDGAVFEDQAALRGTDQFGDARGVYVADLDNDGDVDAVVTNCATGGVVLYEQKAGGMFLDITSQSGISAPVCHGGGALTDYDRDGFVDVWFAGEPMSLWRNLGGMQFTEVTQMVGLPIDQPGHKGMFGDFDNDGDGDFFFVSAPARYYRNENGTFIQLPATGLELTGSVRGSTPGDYDNDGDLDVYVTRWSGESNRLFRNNSDGTFTDVTSAASLTDGMWSQGACWGDFNNDGYLDLYVTNDGFRETDRLFLNQGNDTFVDVTSLDSHEQIGN